MFSAMYGFVSTNRSISLPVIKKGSDSDDDDTDDDVIYDFEQGRGPGSEG